MKKVKLPTKYCAMALTMAFELSKSAIGTERSVSLLVAARSLGKSLKQNNQQNAQTPPRNAEKKKSHAPAVRR